MRICLYKKCNGSNARTCKIRKSGYLRNADAVAKCSTNQEPKLNKLVKIMSNSLSNSGHVFSLVHSKMKILK